MNTQNRLRIFPTTALVSLFFAMAAVAAGQAPVTLNTPVDITGDFRAAENFYYLADQLAGFDPATRTGKITYQRGGGKNS